MYSTQSSLLTISNIFFKAKDNRRGFWQGRRYRVHEYTIVYPWTPEDNRQQQFLAIFTPIHGPIVAVGAEDATIGRLQPQ